MTIATAHEEIWAGPAPLWGLISGDPSQAQRAASMRRPAILRFASDSFMEDLAATLERDPARLADLRAVPETWRAQMVTPDVPPALPRFARRLNGSRLAMVRPPALAAAGPPARRDPELPAHGAQRGPFKLYQPAHQRFYLVAASLVCQLPSMPDRQIESGAGERASFVLRRLRPRQGVTGAPAGDGWPGQWEELAFVVRGGEGFWERPPADDALAPGEDRNPLFPLVYPAPDGRRRRLLAGLIPVGRREVYMGAPERPPPPPGGAAPSAADQAAAARRERRLLLEATVAEPWMQLIDQAAAHKILLDAAPLNGGAGPSSAQKLAQRNALRSGLQVGSWYVLLDLLVFLKEHLPPLYNRLRGGAPPLTDAELAALGAMGDLPLLGLSLTPGNAPPPAQVTELIAGTGYAAEAVDRSLRAALEFLAGDAQQSKLELVTSDYDRAAAAPPADWPARLFPLADPEYALARARVTALVEALAAALPLEAPARSPQVPAAALGAPLDAGGPGYFVIRCVYERPACGPLHPPLLSAPSAVCELAPFFDPDAPARAIRIAMPLDTTPAGLRKFAKNTAFLISDTLACQKERLGGLTFGDLVLSVLPWPFHKDLPSGGGSCVPGRNGFGLICSLSIPIITICALVLLLIMVTLLDIIFRWLPFFILCLPLPGMKGKR